MCGIAAIVSGIHVSPSSLDSSLPPSRPLFVLFTLRNYEEKVSVCIDDIKAALRRRGPDSLGSKMIYLCSDDVNDVGEAVDERKHDFEDDESVAELCFIGATLQLRGINPIVQPLVDSSCNVLVYNGEIFGGINVESDSNDAEILMHSLSKCCSCVAHEHTKECSLSGEERNSVPELLSMIKGPWALIYWQRNSKTMWFGRDAFGRRSLLVHWPTSDDGQLFLSSVSPHSSADKSSDFEDKSQSGNLSFWEELPCGVYSLSVAASRLESNMIGEVKKHEWTNALLEELIIWERAFVEPKPENIIDFHSKLSDLARISVYMPAQIVLRALRESVMRRTTMNRFFQAIEYDCTGKKLVPVAVLFSGGLDSMILASLLDNCLDPRYEIDLLNVSFDGELAPDRITGRAGLKELERISPSRKWKLVEIEAELSKLESESQHVMSLINPASTYMDLNIGLALWLAAAGDGWIYEDGGSNGDITHLRVKYKSEARILLVGAGADEQCAGYGRHRTRYRNGSWVGLHEEMKLDMQRIWKRNLGRDDRCIADNGKEARFPFLDEDVIKTLLDIPLWEIADLGQPSGSGDKKILREVAQLLGLHEAAGLPKRAIQFGSRIARESNRKNFGSNRAANMASAGSAAINRSSN